MWRYWPEVDPFEHHLPIECRPGVPVKHRIQQRNRRECNRVYRATCVMTRMLNESPPGRHDSCFLRKPLAQFGFARVPGEDG